MWRNARRRVGEAERGEPPAGLVGVSRRPSDGTRATASSSGR